MSTSNGVIPNGHQSKREDGVVYRLSGTVIVPVILSLPLLGFVICIVISLITDYDEATSTACSDESVGKVPNFLPSISAAIGNFTPQRYVWRITFSLHLAPRYLLAVMHYKYNMSFPVTSNRAWFRRLNLVACLVHLCELTGLLLVTYVSSTENYPVHEKGFKMFVMCGELYIILTLIIFWWARQELTWTTRDIQSFRLKVASLCLMLACTGLTFYFFTRHMNYCEPNVYSWFAVFEYLLVVASTAFHASWMLLDFWGASMKVTVPARPGQYSNLPV